MPTPLLPTAQEDAITDRDTPYVLVSAGAGSGKTSVLTRRYFHLLVDDGLKVEQILTLTFTRKAAQEMRERIALKLIEEGRVFEARRLTRAPIGTIHSFCEQFLRAEALQAGIDPHFRLLDDPEARTLQEEALDTLFQEVWDGDAPDRDDLARLLLDFRQAELRAAMIDLLRATRTRGMTRDAILPALPGDITLAATAALNAVETLTIVPGTPVWREKTREVAAVLPALRDALWACVESPTWEARDDAEGYLARLTPPGGGGAGKDARDAVKAAFAAFMGACHDHLATPYLTAMTTMLGRFDALYAGMKTARGFLDFDDLLLLTRELLCAPDSPVAARWRREIRHIMVDEFQDTNPLQGAIIHALLGDGGRLFMVGDVKQAIYRFIGSDLRVFLAREQEVLTREDARTGRRIAMLTNYRSRREIIEPINALFTSLWGEAAHDNGFRFEPLDPGARYADKPIPCIEIACWDEGHAPELRAHEARWIARRILQLTGQVDGMAALPLTRRPDHPDAPLAEYPATFRDIILLFRATTHIPRYEAALREAGVPFYTVSGSGFFARREVQDLIYLLRVAQNPMDDFSLAVVLRSPLVGVCDDTLYALSRDWRAWHPGAPLPTAKRAGHGRLWEAIAQVDTLPVIGEDDRTALIAFRALMAELRAELPAGQPLDLLDLALARTEYAEGLLAAEDGEQAYANVQKLREEAARFQGRGIFDIADFERYLSNLDKLQPREASAPINVEGSNVVRMMTIHAAKGLEAPIVFLADCGYQPRPITDTFLLDGSCLVGKVPTPDDERASPAAYLRALEREQVEARREAERLLYVAVTRAREHLICCGHPGRGMTYTRLLSEHWGLQTSSENDQLVQVTHEGASYPIQVWSARSLAAVEAITPPRPHATAWEEHGAALQSGADLPARISDADLAMYTEVLARLHALPPSRRTAPLRVGVSRLTQYHDCPRHYWLRYELRAEGEDARAEHDLLLDAAETPSPGGAQFGLLAHQALQRIDFLRPLVDQTEELLAAWARETGQAVTAPDAARLRETLARFARLPVVAMLRDAEHLHREQRFLALIEGVYVPGIIDVLGYSEDAWWLVDYKTGHRAPGAHFRQLGVYALGARAALGIAPARVMVVYLDEADPSQAVCERRVTPAFLDVPRVMIREAGEGLRQGQYPARPGPGCPWCPYRTACAACDA